MAGRNGIWSRVVVLVGGLLGLAVSLAVVGVALRGRGLAVAANVAQLVSVVLGAPSLAIGLVGWWRRSAVPSAAGTADILRAKDVLAGLVAEQWNTEKAIRALDDPDPIPVRWRTPEQPPTAGATVLMDHRANIEPDTGRGGGVWWRASSADIAVLADRFRRTRRRRLVILGGAGMGKTTLAMQLLLHLLDTRTPDEPIPVLLPVAGWDTAHVGLRAWLADQLARTYPALRSPELGVDVVRALIGRGHILPVLDGLDELPPPARAKTIIALNSTLGGDQLILTSRTTEFTAAVTDANDVVTSAAVLEPLPLTPAAAADYLTRALPPSPGSGWQQILTDLRTTPAADQTPPSGPGAVLADVAATPLGLWLLRSVYSTHGNDPTELANAVRFPTPAVVRAHLFDQIIPALITARAPSEDPADLFRPRRRHDPARVRRYLGYLAHLPIDDSQTGTRDFAWWQLARHTVKPHTARFVVGLVSAFGAGIAAALVTGLTDGLVSGLEDGIAGGVLSGLAGGFAASSWLKEVPGSARLARRPTSLSHLVKGGLAGGLAFGLMVGLVFGLIVGLIVGLEKGFAGRPGDGLAGGLVSGFAGGLGAGLAGGLVAGLIHLVETPTPADQVSTPLTSLRTDRSLNILRTIAGGLAFALVVGLWSGFEEGPEDGLLAGLATGLGVGLAGGLVAGRHHAWPAYLMATNRLAWRGLLPRRLMPFIDDMHRLGLLRAVGPIYQFRHAELQEHLAAAYRRHGRPKSCG